MWKKKQEMLNIFYFILIVDRYDDDCTSVSEGFIRVRYILQVFFFFQKLIYYDEDDQYFH